MKTSSVKRAAARLLVVSLMAGGCVGLAAAPAEAVSANQGKYPYETSCDNDATLTRVSSKAIPGTSGSAVIYLAYSPSCRTVWVQLDYNSPWPVTMSKLSAWVHRNSDGKQYMASSPWDEGGSAVSRVSRMIDDKNVTSYAAGSYNGGTVVKTASY